MKSNYHIDNWKILMLNTFLSMEEKHKPVGKKKKVSNWRCWKFWKSEYDFGEPGSKFNLGSDYNSLWSAA